MATLGGWISEGVMDGFWEPGFLVMCRPGLVAGVRLLVSRWIEVVEWLDQGGNFFLFLFLWKGAGVFDAFRTLAMQCRVIDCVALGVVVVR